MRIFKTLLLGSILGGVLIGKASVDLLPLSILLIIVLSLIAGALFRIGIKEKRILHFLLFMIVSTSIQFTYWDTIMGPLDLIIYWDVIRGALGLSFEQIAGVWTVLWNVGWSIVASLVSFIGVSIYLRTKNQLSRLPSV